MKRSKKKIKKKKIMMKQKKQNRKKSSSDKKKVKKMQRKGCQFLTKCYLISSYIKQTFSDLHVYF